MEVFLASDMPEKSHTQRRRKGKEEEWGERKEEKKKVNGCTLSFILATLNCLKEERIKQSRFQNSGWFIYLSVQFLTHEMPHQEAVFSLLWEGDERIKLGSVVDLLLS